MGVWGDKECIRGPFLKTREEFSGPKSIFQTRFPSIGCILSYKLTRRVFFPKFHLSILLKT